MSVTKVLQKSFSKEISRLHFGAVAPVAKQVTDKMKEIEKVILWACIEYYAGLWDIPAEIRNVRPELPNDQLVAIAKAILSDFLNRKLVIAYICQEPYQELNALTTHQATAALLAVANWLEPQKDARSIRLSATEAGESAYQKLF